MKSQISGLANLFLLFSLFACHRVDRTSSSETKIVDRSHEHRDLLSQGPFAYNESLYSEEAAVDHDVLPTPPGDEAEIKTDIRGKLYLPKGAGPFPLLIFMHGNHGTCGVLTGENNPRLDESVDFTLTGACPEGMVESPSFLGYEYAARHLASWGYAVVSINANRGITGRNSDDAQDPALVYARGALVLKHLSKLWQWAESGDTSSLANKTLDVKSKFDFAEVGLMGHSRGGEGVRQAYNIYDHAKADSIWRSLLPHLKIKGIFEIAPVDFGTGADPVKVEAVGTAWAVLIAGCDRDVSTFNGTNPYIRMLDAQDAMPKAIFAVWGANHNFFNSEWQVSDAPHSCYGTQKPLWNTAAEPLPPPYGEQDPIALKGVKGSDKQQAFAKGLMFSFFKANIGKQRDPSLLHSFDSQYALPEGLDKLAPSSREYIRATDGILLAQPGKGTPPKHQEGAITWQSLSDKLDAEIPALQNYWNAYAKANGYKELVVKLIPGTYARQVLALDADTLATEQTVDIPFSTSTNSSGYWTIDATLARRTACYTYPETACPLDESVSEVDVAMIHDDGSSSAFVHLTDYVKLENFHNTYFDMASADSIGGAENALTLSFSIVPLLFSTARFELTDFALQNPLIKGLRFKFPAGKPVALSLDEIRLVKRSKAE